MAGRDEKDSSPNDRKDGAALSLFFKSKDKNKKQSQSKKSVQLTPRSVSLIAAAVVGVVAGITVLSFSPGSLLPFQDNKNNKKATIPQISQPYNDEKQDVSLPKPPERKPQLPKTFESPFQRPQLPQLPDFTNRIPTELPSMEPPKPQMRPPETRQGPDEKSLAVYAKHAEMTKNLGNGLNEAFQLDKMPDPPTKPGESKFSSAYVLLDNNESIERVDLMSIVKNDSMRGIKTAKDALNALVEESGEVNIIEAEESYLIYDISGGKGYQVGKISLDDNGIYISGYVNYTTSKMPNFLRDQWIKKLKPV